MPKLLPIWAVHCLMVLSAGIVSTSFTVGAAITNSLDPAVLLLIRYLLAVLFFAPILIFRYGFSLPSLKQLVGYSAISFSTVGFFWCMFESLRYTTAINTSVIFTLVPGISGIYSAVLFKERLGRYRLLALLCGMFGAVWVVFRGDINCLLTMDVNHGDLIFLAGCFLMAAYTPLVKQVYRQESMVIMTFWVLVTGAGWLLLLAAPQLGQVDWPGVKPHIWFWILYLAFFSTVITFYLSHLATLYLGPTRTMAYSYFYPAFVLVIDWGCGQGLPPAVIMPGIIVVTCATVVLQRGGAEPAYRLPENSTLTGK
ncbi:MAG: hypothetical protein A2511_03200 [Deltaproteobacteria bacterium RIFOXYD12_FULL_50_9]|nr:MAG: hypothetical protein A2511_03200 [Deltaproteobacteria bacterium RIFOXYD12_FULL_50_9]